MASRLSELVRDMDGLQASIRTVSGKEKLQRIISQVSKLETDFAKLKDYVGVMSEMYIGTPGDVRTKGNVRIKARGEMMSLKPEVANKIEYLKAAQTFGIKESEDRVVDFGDAYKPELVKVLIVYLNLGSDIEYAKLPKLEQADILALMDLCTQMDLPKICLKLAQQIDETTADISLLLSSSKHVGVSTCLKGWKLAYEKATSAVASRIETFSKDEGFRDLPVSILKDVMDHIKRLSKLKCELSVPKASTTKHCRNGFELELRDTDDSLELITSLTQVQGAAARLHRSLRRIAQFQVEYTVISASLDNKHNRTVSSSASFVSHSETLRLLKKDTKQRDDFMHGEEGSATYKVTVKVSWTKLHRQCNALLNYPPRKDATTDTSCTLLETLSYFHSQKSSDPASSECCNYLSKIVIDFVARGFVHLKDIILLSPPAWVKLPCSLIEDIIKQDCLHAAKDELSVLKFVIAWSMEAMKENHGSGFAGQKRKRDSSCSSEVDKEKSGGGSKDQQQASEASVGGGGGGRSGEGGDVDEEPFNRLIVHVRFPFISITQLLGLTSEEVKFARQYPLYNELKSEAMKLQIEATRTGPASGASSVKKSYSSTSSSSDDDDQPLRRTHACGVFAYTPSCASAPWWTKPSDVAENARARRRVGYDKYPPFDYTEAASKIA